MTKLYKNILKIALLGVAMAAASGCTLGTVAFMDDYPPGLENAVGNAGGDNDPSDRNNRGNNPGGDVSETGEESNGGGSHPNAGGGNGSEIGEDGKDMDPGNSGNSQGNSGENDT